MRDALLRMVKAARRASHVSNALNGIGYHGTPYTDIYGDVADAIYYLIGEETPEFSQSVTFLVLTNDRLSDSGRVDVLLKEYHRNKTATA